jgi:hypothetical protein
MKTTLIAAMAALGVALVALAFAAPAPGHAARNGYRTAATNAEGDGGTNPYASPIPARPMPGPSAPT